MARRFAGVLLMDGRWQGRYGPVRMNARPDKAPPVPPHPGLDVREDSIVWNGRFPLQRVRFTYERFDGARSGELTWELWRRGGAVVVLPYDPWSDRIALIEQFRLPALAAGFKPIMTECVAGLLEPGEDPLEAARRETLEESGLEPDLMEPVGHFMLMQGGCDEHVRVFCGRVRLAADAQGQFGLVAEHEDTRVRVMTAAEGFAMIDGGEMQNATGALALMWLRHHRDRLRREWAA